MFLSWKQWRQMTRRAEVGVDQSAPSSQVGY